MRYSLATTTWDEKEIKAIHDVIDSNRFTMGDKVKQFELESANYFGSKYSVMVNSGSSANLLSVAALMYSSNNKLKLNKGDEVIVPAVSWSTTYYPLHQYGLKLKFVDISLDSLNINLDVLEDAITSDTKAIYAVNLLGAPNDFDRLTKICNEYNLVLLEDNCESMGASYKGRFTGTFGAVGSMSTFFSHHICTIEGGLVLTDDEELYQILQSLRAHGWTRELPKDNFISAKSDNDFYELFRFVLPGYNLRPTEISGALGLEQLKKLDNILDARWKNAHTFVELFKNSNEFFIQQPPDSMSGSSWFGFSLILKPEFAGKRNQLVKWLSNNNIESRPIVAGNFVNNPVIKYMEHQIHGQLTNAEYLDQNGLFVGNNHSDLTNEIYYLYDTLELFFKG